MKYYWISSTIEIKTAVLPCREINTKIMSFLLILSLLLIIFIGFLSHFIDHFYNIFRSSKSGPWLLHKKTYTEFTDIVKYCLVVLQKKIYLSSKNKK